MTVAIVPLSSVPGHVDRLADWHFREWGTLMAPWSLDGARRELVSHLDGEFPTTFVALSAHGDVLGSASLIAEDAPELSAYSPWLASLIVHPDWRGRGIGTRLTEAVVERARWCGFRAVFLFTADRCGFYHRLGWRTERQTWLGTVQVDVMARPL